MWGYDDDDEEEEEEEGMGGLVLIAGYLLTWLWWRYKINLQYVNFSLVTLNLGWVGNYLLAKHSRTSTISEYLVSTA